MAQQLTIQTWCDVCLETNEKREAEESGPFLIGDRTKVVVDVCEQHRKELVDPLADLLARYGREYRKPSAKPTPTRQVGAKAKVPCPECGEMMTAGAGLGSHRWRAHGVPGEGRAS